MVSYRLVSDAGSLAYQRADQIATSAALLPATFPIIVGAFIIGSRPDIRRLYLTRTLKPLGALLALAAGVLFFYLLGNGVLTGGQVDEPPENPPASFYVMLVYLLFLLILALWVFLFLCCGITLSLIHMFRTADIHEVLPPVIAAVLVWELAIVDVFANAYDGAPPLAQAAMILGAPLSVTAVSFWELRRLKTRHRLTVRQALGR